MKGVISIILGLLIIFQGQGIANDYVFDPVTFKTGITFNAINSVVEDKYGFIWFGCNSGLYYYNSSEIFKFNFDLSKEDAPSSNIIRYIYKDKKQKLWLCTNDGICYFDEASNSFRKLNLLLSGSNASINSTRIQQISDNEYLTVANGRLFKFNLRDLQLELLAIVSPETGITNFTSDASGNIFISASNGTIYISDTLISDIKPFYRTQTGTISTLSAFDDQLWIGYERNGIEIINMKGERVDDFKSDRGGSHHIIKNRVRRIVKCNNDIWVGTQGGITVIRKDGNYDITPNKQNGLPHEGIFDLFVDRIGGVWVATWSGGLAYYHHLNFKFPHIQSTLTNKTLSNSVVSSFSEDGKGTIWVGSENHGMHMYSPKNNSYVKKEDFPVQRIKSIITDDRNRIWIGTLFEGLWIKENEKIRRIKGIDGIISTVLPTDEGAWIGERGGGTRFYNEKRNSVEVFLENSLDTSSICSNSIWDIFEDSRGNIWFCSDNGISVKHKNTDHFTNYYKQTHGLSSNVNYSISEDHKGNIWIGTAGFGIDIYNPNTKRFGKFSLNEDLENVDIYCILRDKKDNMWFSSNQGIFAYYFDSHKLKHFSEEDGLSGQQFHPNSGYLSKAGVLYFGGGNGFNIIDPEIVQPNTSNAEIFLSKLSVNNQSIDKQIPRYINSKYLPLIHEVELDYNQNSIVMAFVANSFIKNSKSIFRYRLLGYIDDWDVVEYNSDVSFTKLPPGDYILQLEYINNDGLSPAPIKEIRIEINPPFWLSWYAYSLYAILILIIILIAVRELRFREKSKIEQMLFNEKVKFFTNVSHEFRTPLTLIISPINALLKRFPNDAITYDNLKIIQRNADRLLRLTNQILDFRLIEIGNVKLKRENVDIINLCKNVFDCFEFQVSEKEINCIFNSSFKSFELLVDAEKIEKVVYNILSNALKHSNEKGQIILSIEKKTLGTDIYSRVFSTGTQFTGDSLEIKIKDNGKGIKNSILENIFDRFFSENEEDETGTGIGLHICQEFIRLHNGNIMVESEKGNGSVFSINIPIESQTKFEKEKLILQSFFDKSSDKSIQVEQENVSNTKPVVIFAEDNNELRGYYKNLLSAKYKVISAKNGTQAFEIASELIPDIIISDILMPGMDGMSLIEQIRNSAELNHIPIILLTAVSDNKVKIESMHKGANAFLTKPVDEELLFAKIDSVLRNAEVVRNKYKAESARRSENLGSGQSFIEKVEQIVENNLQNQSFEITELASQIGISRSSLQRKIKRRVNMSPSEFIREIRLKKAVELLKNNDYNIDEIAIIVGFNSTSYFIRSFKKKYEMTPTEYKQQIEK